MTAAKYPPALGPRGVSLEITLGQGQVLGELIEVRESGLVLLADAAAESSSAVGSSQARHPGRLQFVPYSEMRSWRVYSTNTLMAFTKGPLDRDGREHFRLLSRFPQGLTPDLLQLLLTAHGQTELPGVSP